MRAEQGSDHSRASPQRPAWPRTAFSPPVDSLLQEALLVEGCPWSQLPQPADHLLGRPPGDRLVDEEVVLGLPAAPVMAKQDHLVSSREGP